MSAMYEEQRGSLADVWWLTALLDIVKEAPPGRRAAAIGQLAANMQRRSGLADADSVSRAADQYSGVAPLEQAHVFREAAAYLVSLDQSSASAPAAEGVDAASPLPSSASDESPAISD